jgi:hypothetical protein
MKKFIQLIANCGDYWLLPMPNVKTADSPCKIYVAISVNVFEQRILSFCHIDRRAM